jgi:hypothetical protein
MPRLHVGLLESAWAKPQTGYGLFGGLNSEVHYGLFDFVHYGLFEGGGYVNFLFGTSSGATKRGRRGKTAAGLHAAWRGLCDLMANKELLVFMMYMGSRVHVEDGISMQRCNLMVALFAVVYVSRMRRVMSIVLVVGRGLNSKQCTLLILASECKTQCFIATRLYIQHWHGVPGQNLPNGHFPHTADVMSVTLPAVPVGQEQPV